MFERGDAAGQRYDGDGESDNKDEGHESDEPTVDACCAGVEVGNSTAFITSGIP